MPTLYQASEFLKQYIKAKEGCAKWDEAAQRYIPYADGGGLSTIGYGHLITHSEVERGLFNQGLTPVGCDILFQSDLRVQVNLVNSLNILDLTQGQFDALVDFCWNCGFKALNAALHERVSKFPDHCIHYIHNARGIIEPGLVNRRKDEVSWWYETTTDAA